MHISFHWIWYDLIKFSPLSNLQNYFWFAPICSIDHKSSDLQTLLPTWLAITLLQNIKICKIHSNSMVAIIWCGSSSANTFEGKRKTESSNWTCSKWRRSKVHCMRWRGFNDYVMAVEFNATRDQRHMHVLDDN